MTILQWTPKFSIEPMSVHPADWKPHLMTLAVVFTARFCNTHSSWSEYFALPPKRKSICEDSLVHRKIKSFCTNSGNKVWMIEWWIIQSSKFPVSKELQCTLHVSFASGYPKFIWVYFPKDWKCGIPSLNIYSYASVHFDLIYFLTFSASRSSQSKVISSPNEYILLFYLNLRRSLIYINNRSSPNTFPCEQK